MVYMAILGLLLANGQMAIVATPQPYPTEEACKEKIASVEQVIISQDVRENGVVAYSLQCIPLTPEQFKLNGKPT